MAKSLKQAEIIHEINRSHYVACNHACFFRFAGEGTPIDSGSNRRKQGAPSQDRLIELEKSEELEVVRFFVAPADPSQNVVLFDTKDWSRKIQHRIQDNNFESNPSCAAISSDGKTLAIALTDTRVEIWELSKIQQN